ncbi:DMT family transporter [Rubinisphaera sp.]|uniref:DMT family transporter n=1 Tax=Rubinisphaera sp. TaxID=2024857 RepID=UPI000C0FD085|nr:DMT family transporter [Rubinisphaera sp.]MBV10401.1 hypothetical protein [Rubinisphaera sp.]HCS52475.1 hypothetical protein [Planctomycetaceae bacterium]|tara:strand:- start:1278 stop:2261 length:984 start_codon:yes stop_codon:yes gene_type:complete
MNESADLVPSTGKLTGIFALLGALLVWSSWAIVARWGFAHSELDAWDLGFLRFFFAALCMTPVLIRKGWRGLSWSTILLIAFCAGPGYATFAYAGLEFAPSSHGAALTAGMLPLFTTALAVWLKQTKLTGFMIAGLVLILSAAFAFFLDGLQGAGDLIWLGDLLLICGPALWAIYTVKIKQEMIDAFHATAIVSVIGFLIYLPIYFAVGTPQQLMTTDWKILLTQGLFHGIVVVVIALTFYSHAVNNLGPAITTMSLSVVPGVTAIAAWFILQEPFTQWSRWGVLLDGLGILCIVMAAREQQRVRNRQAQLDQSIFLNQPKAEPAIE